MNGWKKVARSLGTALLLAVSMCMVSFADEVQQDQQFVPGTTVNGIGIGGMTVEEAKARIEGFYAQDYKLTIVKKGGSKEYIGGSDIGYKVEVPEGLKAILDEQNASGRNSGPSVDNSHKMEMAVTYDKAVLEERIRGLSCVSGSGIVETKDAYISAYQEGQAFSIIPEVYGNNVDVEKVISTVTGAVAAGGSEVNLDSSGCYYAVNVTSSDENLKNLCATMNQCKDMVITYTFGEESQQLTGGEICTWLTGSVDGQIGVNRDMAAAYVKSLSDKYDTAGKARNFRTTSGRDVSLTGPYGWKIAQAAETDALIGMIRTGQSQSREPQYAVQASGRGGNDWGGTYVEVDMAGQHVYMYRDGALVWDAPCVTGNVSKGHTTPGGIYGLNYKQTDRILRGEKQADGTYEYESHVDYWMPFNGGIGLHDANWRSKFGGTIYQYGGSHGCINLPPSKAEELYGLVYTGIPVICFS